MDKNMLVDIPLRSEERMKKPKPKYKPTRTFSVEKDGFYGEYHEPEQNLFPGKGMVICSGSDGSFLLSQLGADKFVDAGMPVLALGYWNVPGTPEDPFMCPVEYMQRACQWLREQKGMHPGVWGISLGGEYVLLCASIFPEIECVVAASPVHIVTQCGSFSGGLHFAAGSPFSQGGQAVPYVSVSVEKAHALVKRMKKNFLKRREPDMLFYYDELLKTEHDPEADIRVENIKAPVLLLSGASDVMVPADWVCEQVMKRLDQNGFSYPHIHKSYDPLSHYVCPLRPMTTSMFRVERRQKAACNANREQSWHDTLEFLEHKWIVE